MKIAFLSFYSGAIDRGVETATAALAKGLSHTHEVIVYQVGDRTLPDINTVRLPASLDWKIKESSGTFLRHVYFDYWSRKITAFTFQFLPDFLKYKYDIVIPTNGGWQVIIVRLITWFFGKKILVQGNAGIGIDDFFQLHCFPDHFIAISPQGYRWARQFAPWTKKSYIPYGVDIKQFREVKAVTIPLKRPVVLCVAAFSPYKRIDLLIIAMVRVQNASLLVVGQGNLEQDLQLRGTKLLRERFLLKTGVAHDQLIGYYKGANIFSLPSAANEAFGIVYVEAMAAGLPVVAPNDFNRREIIGEAGILVDPENTAAYAKAIESALSKDFGDVPQKQAEKFSWKKIVEQYEKLLVNTL